MGYRSTAVPRNAAPCRQRGLRPGHSSRPLHRQTGSFVCLETGEYHPGRRLQGLCARTHFPDPPLLWLKPTLSPKSKVAPARFVTRELLAVEIEPPLNVSKPALISRPRVRNFALKPLIVPPLHRTLPLIVP